VTKRRLLKYSLIPTDEWDTIWATTEMNADLSELFPQFNGNGAFGAGDGGY
jgi:hypothetical protein